MDDAKSNELVETVLRQLIQEGLVKALPVESSVEKPAHALTAASGSLVRDLTEPTEPELRYKPRVQDPKDPAALKELIASTPSRIGVGRAGPRYNTFSQLLFQGDQVRHALVASLGSQPS